MCTSSIAECQTECDFMDIVLPEDKQPRCSTPKPAELSLTFQDDPMDTTYEPSLEDSGPALAEPCPRKIIVFEENLLQLVKSCRKCHLPAKSSLEVFGSLAVVTSTCQDGHVLSWHSQPKMKRFAMGNVALAAAILFTGSSPTQVLRLFQSAGIACFSKRTYDHLQRDIMIPAVHQLWEREQQSLLSCLSRTGAQLAGDSRADSPGYSAKYGTYSLLDTSLNRIIDMQLVQSNEVTSSGAMELEGLKRALKGLEDQKVCVRELVTDRHTQSI
ncbi:uncharacterized protein LOC125940287 [Dermacentor silvarum]|uniref:uncharacterized protein LOC125940287 n=1 Tax=Dermacentor silvarum TaxID=543639 RepID=UPI0021014E56|nr:uncharacterized protein LOC125940287 [Dermacentor silvarum]